MPATVQRCLTPAEQQWIIWGENKHGGWCSPVSACHCRGWSLAREAFCFFIASAANQPRMGGRGEGVKESQLMDLRDHYNGKCAEQCCGFSSHSEISSLSLYIWVLMDIVSESWSAEQDKLSLCRVSVCFLQHCLLSLLISH